eukprot:12886892-Prorocentrum_lima.AAC.1
MERRRGWDRVGVTAISTQLAKFVRWHLWCVLRIRWDRLSGAASRAPLGLVQPLVCRWRSPSTRTPP